MKQAYERYLDERDWEYREIEVLPHCKRVTEHKHLLTGAGPKLINFIHYS